MTLSEVKISHIHNIDSIHGEPMVNFMGPSAEKHPVAMMQAHGLLARWENHFLPQFHS